MVIKLENVGIAVRDIEAAIAFFVDLGLSVLGRDEVSGEWTDTAVGLDGNHAKIAMLQTQRAAAENALADTQLLAPFDGYVAQKFAETFETVAAGQLIVTLLQCETIEVTVGVPPVISPSTAPSSLSMTIHPSSTLASTAAPTSSAAPVDSTECTGFIASVESGTAPPSFVITCRRAWGACFATTFASDVTIRSPDERRALLMIAVRSRIANELL